MAVGGGSDKRRRQDEQERAEGGCRTGIARARRRKFLGHAPLAGNDAASRWESCGGACSQDSRDYGTSRQSIMRYAKGISVDAVDS